MRQAYPLGNGRLGFMPAGNPGSETITINLDSLWTGGPFENKSYSGGNPPDDRSHFLPGIRDKIFRDGEGDVDGLLSPISSYGTYTPLANLTVEIEGIEDYSSYFRGLDLASGVHSVRFSSDGQDYNVSALCSHPDNVCVYLIASSEPLPKVTFGLHNNFLNATLVNTTCANARMEISGHLAQPGMQFIGIAQPVRSRGMICSEGQLVLPTSAKAREITVVFGAGTDYDATKGDKASGYSFRGIDPAPAVRKAVSAAASSSYQQILKKHEKDYKRLFGAFELELPDFANSSRIETSALLSSYDTSKGDPFLESLFVDLGRYLLISSSRENSLPANLQGRWADLQNPAWSADYHANINLQMNYWAAPQVGLGSLQQPLWDYIEQTWVPYGQETARLLYGALNGSWVVHDEINIFGYTGMKNEATWANYPLAGTWMALHIPSWLEYSGDEEWYRRQGYPILKGATSFWLSQLQEDRYFNDRMLVVNPCNSPEHGPTTFGCSNHQQQIFELFDRILATWSLAGDDDEDFRQQVNRTLDRLDRGIHIGSWGQLQEWKRDIDIKNDTHRHLSGLTGWYPGYSVSQNADSRVTKAVEKMLWSRGDGKNTEDNPGWAKVWRSACWAHLNNTERANFELRYSISENMAENGLSQYSGHNAPFQIDANFGFVAAFTAILIRDLPQFHDDDSIHTVLLGPAIPSSWSGGSVRGLQLRGGGSIDFSWDDSGVVHKATVNKRSKPLRLVNVEGSDVAV
ncbi:glycoside hydrolase family 95 protein-like protein [Penicillium argentinense]|uniref:Glycoside hydrolase family 95 protein-like protein n=1 Tax=Penicillium argentinense TaxID=1131581 RepID=A0A9W9KBF5_9EURO|nr:glycoside hydrolase family 95 protein-like protein [Penicillium argentinense]KAJ5098897.1 glycoside hydrolase family 95 protein-like protein [Penicillium argentinense]